MIMKRVIASLIRHALTFGGGAGVLSEDQIGQIAGAIVALVGIAWSLADQWMTHRAVMLSRNAQPPGSTDSPHA